MFKLILNANNQPVILIKYREFQPHYQQGKV